MLYYVQAGRSIRKSQSRRRALTTVVAVAVVLATLGGYNFMRDRGSSYAAVTGPQEIHTGFVRENDILSLSEAQLSKRMRYWESSKKISSEPHTR